MGYQVGHICHATKQSAENAYFSQVMPNIHDGKIYQMQYTPLGWQFEGLQVTASLPECDPSQNFQDGLMIGWALFGVSLSMWGIKRIHRWFNR